MTVPRLFDVIPAGCVKWATASFGDFPFRQIFIGSIQASDQLLIIVATSTSS